MKESESRPYHFRIEHFVREKYSPKGVKSLSGIFRDIENEWTISSNHLEELREIAYQAGQTIDGIVSEGGVVSRSGVILATGTEETPSDLVKETEEAGLVILTRKNAEEEGYILPEGIDLYWRSFLVFVPPEFYNRLAICNHELVDAVSPRFPIKDRRHNGKGYIPHIEESFSNYTKDLFIERGVDYSFLRPRSIAVGHLYDIAAQEGQGFVTRESVFPRQRNEF